MPEWNIILREIWKTEEFTKGATTAKRGAVSDHMASVQFMHQQKAMKERCDKAKQPSSDAPVSQLNVV